MSKISELSVEVVKNGLRSDSWNEMRALLRSDDPITRANASGQLATIFRQLPEEQRHEFAMVALPLLAERLKDEKPGVARSAAIAIGEFGNESDLIVSQLTSAVDPKRDDDLVIFLVEAIGNSRTEDRSAYAVLWTLLRLRTSDSETVPSDVAISVLQALCKLPIAKEFRNVEFQKFLDAERDPIVKGAAAVSLLQISKKDTEVARAFLESAAMKETPFNMREVIWFINLLVDAKIALSPPVFEFLEQAKKSPSLEVRRFSDSVQAKARRQSQP